ncbi:hypothetical protein INH39_20430 [Massilia violaceinigra]|uniref:Uncharacterized protein n=1 Tax=Massilia violaceinigra TaxID=2045208 RepID=A0ABY3ZZD6_9BURK|nr:hypothetical protein [Massilia violaceinigra]UOD27845.1 hypothetical protein INH39_20430 [Massilia violaceinigra]
MTLIIGNDWDRLGKVEGVRPFDDIYQRLSALVASQGELLLPFFIPEHHSSLTGLVVRQVKCCVATEMMF